MIRRCLIVLLLAAPALAQEFDIFDENDFVDPRERGATFTAGGTGQSNPGITVALSRVFIGHVKNYQWRNSRQGADVEFAHFNTSLYWASSQINLKLTTFRDREDTSRLPSYRGTFQYGWYFVTEPKEKTADESEDERIAGRCMVTLTMEENPFRDEAHREQFLYELGVESTASVKGITGSLVWIRRRIENDKSVDRLTYFYRTGNKSYRSGIVRANVAAGIGAERNEGWHWASRVVLSSSVRLPAFENVSLNVSYAPTYLSGQREKSFYHELVAYLDVPLFARALGGRL